MALLESIFDRQAYLDRYPDVAAAGVDPLEHYLTFGETEGRRPLPDFDPVFYAAHYKDALNDMGALEHYVLHGKNAGNVTTDEGFDFDWYRQVYLSPSATDADCREHYSVRNQYNLLRKSGDAELILLRQLFKPEEYQELHPDTAGIDPWIHFVGAGHREGRNLSRWYRANFGDIKTQVMALRRQGWALRGTDVTLDRLDLTALDRLSSSGGKALGPFEEALLDALKRLATEVSALVVVGGLGIGGAERYGANIFRALAGIHGIDKVAMLVSDGEIGHGAQWLPKGARVLGVSDVLPGADRAARARFVRRLIAVVQPRTTYCVNSRALWDAAMKPKNALNSYSRFFATLFCYDHDLVGNEVGYAATEFWQCFDFFAGYLIDNRTFAEKLIRRFSIPAPYHEKLRVVRSPVALEGAVRAVEARPMRALWCGRLARQKLPHVVGRIGALCPGVQIDMFAAPGDLTVESLNLPRNVRVLPPYDPNKGAPFDDYGAFIYSSLWDGIPTVLLDAAASGIPIVGSVVGGIGEVLTERTGWPVIDPHDAQQYVDGLHEALFDPAKAAGRTREMRALLADQHSWTGFDASLHQIEAGALTHAQPRCDRGHQRASRRSDVGQHAAQRGTRRRHRPQGGPVSRGDRHGRPPQRPDIADAGFLRRDGNGCPRRRQRRSGGIAQRGSGACHRRVHCLC